MSTVCLIITASTPIKVTEYVALIMFILDYLAAIWALLSPLLGCKIKTISHVFSFGRLSISAPNLSMPDLVN